MTWTQYQSVHGERVQDEMRRILAGIPNPTLEQIESAACVAELAVDNYPFSGAMVFCDRHSKHSDIIDVDRCQECGKPGKVHPAPREVLCGKK